MHEHVSVHVYIEPFAADPISAFAARPCATRLWVTRRAHEALTRGWSLRDNSTEQHWNCDLSPMGPPWGPLSLFLSSGEHNKCAFRPPTHICYLEFRCRDRHMRRMSHAHGLRIGARLQASGGVYKRAHKALEPDRQQHGTTLEL